MQASVLHRSRRDYIMPRANPAGALSRPLTLFSQEVEYFMLQCFQCFVEYFMLQYFMLQCCFLESITLPVLQGLDPLCPGLKAIKKLLFNSRRLSTKKLYNAKWARFVHFCTLHQGEADSHRLQSLPASQATLLAYIGFSAQEGHIRPCSLHLLSGPSIPFTRTFVLTSPHQVTRSYKLAGASVSSKALKEYRLRRPVPSRLSRCSPACASACTTTRLTMMSDTPTPSMTLTNSSCNFKVRGIEFGTSRQLPVILALQE